MTIQVLLFAGAREAVGESCIGVAMNAPASVGALREQLVQQYPVLERYHSTLLLAVNGTCAADDHSVGCSDEVACFPPVSGG